MDVVWGETAGVDGQLWLLCPILFIMQVIRMYYKLASIWAICTNALKSSKAASEEFELEEQFLYY